MALLLGRRPTPMRLGKASSTLLLTAALALPALPGAGALSPPGAVVALVMSEATLVYWAPSDTASTEISYNVYGIRNGGAEFIENTRLTVSVVLGTYESYAVSTVMNGQESSLKYSVSGVCVKLYETPPAVDTACTTGVYGGTQVPREAAEYRPSTHVGLSPKP